MHQSGDEIPPGAGQQVEIVWNRLVTGEGRCTPKVRMTFALGWDGTDVPRAP